MIVKESLGIDNLIIYQDDELYRFTSDSVILSRFASGKKNAVVADFCSGSGIVGLHYYALNKCVKSVDLVEIQPELASLSQKTVDDNNLIEVFTVINKPIQELDAEYNGKYHLILCNPPYKKAGGGFKNLDDKIAICRHEVTVTQEEIIEVARKINTYDISIKPYEDCCTVFVPKHPAIKPLVKIAEKEESKFEFEPLLEEAVQNTKRLVLHKDKHYDAIKKQFVSDDDLI